MHALDRLARRLFVPREPEAPLDLAIETLEDARDPRAIRAEVLDETRV